MVDTDFNFFLGKLAVKEAGNKKWRNEKPRERARDRVAPNDAGKKPRERARDKVAPNDTEKSDPAPVADPPAPIPAPAPVPPLPMPDVPGPTGVPISSIFDQPAPPGAEPVRWPLVPSTIDPATLGAISARTVIEPDILPDEVGPSVPVQKLKARVIPPPPPPIPPGAAVPPLDDPEVMPPPPPPPVPPDPNLKILPPVPDPLRIIKPPPPLPGEGAPPGKPPADTSVKTESNGQGGKGDKPPYQRPPRAEPNDIAKITDEFWNRKPQGEGVLTADDIEAARRALQDMIRQRREYLADTQEKKRGQS